MDYNSYVLWNDYAQLLRNVSVVGSYAENQKIMAVRKVQFIYLYILIDISNTISSCVCHVAIPYGWSVQLFLSLINDLKFYN